MSTKTYNALISETSELIGECTQADEAIFEAGPSEKSTFNPILSELRVRYTILLSRLDTAYDQILQPQKRRIIKRLLDACLGRLLEIKFDLVELNLSDYTYDDDEALKKLGVTPMNAEPCIPQYFLRDREKELGDRRQFILDILKKLGYEPTKPTPLVLNEQQAVIIIQSHERARQGRLRGQFMKEIRLLKEKGRDQKGEMSASAATAIQRVWRGFIARRATRKRKQKEQLLIGMELPPYLESKEIKKAEKIKDYRRQLQQQYDSEYNESLIETEERLRAKHSTKIAERIGDELRRWITEYYERTGKLPEFPSEEAGGSRAMFSRQGTGVDSELSKLSPISSKGSKRSKDSKEKRSNKTEEIKNKDENEDLFTFKCTPSVFLQEIISANEEYEDIWKFRDVEDDIHEMFDKEMIEREKLGKIEQEIRNDVDEMMRGELDLIQAAFDRDRAHKGKKAKKPQKKVRRGGKKNKKKKEKDLTPDRTTESLFEELVTNGIIRPYPLVNIDDYFGEKNFVGNEFRNQDQEPIPCLGDIRQLVKEYCILPLGSENVRARAPFVRSVLITGPSGSGKKMLVHAICSEIGAMLFDLTPANIVGKYPGKSGLIMLLHLVMKVSRLLQPAVIWMDDAEKPFVKKIPKTDKTDPKRLKKDLVKIIKGICAEDRVIFIGTSRTPWEAEQKLLFQCYSKVIQIPRPDYGSVSLMWRSKLHRAGALSNRLDVSCLSRVSDSYTIGTLLSALESVLTTKRRLQLRVRALTSHEVAVQLSSLEPVYVEQDAAAETWWLKTPMEKRRLRMLQKLQELELENEEKAAATKGNGSRKRGGGYTDLSALALN
ncbi:IQ and AAA domain-containing protein 1-like [Leptidea sinapis]|uniref:IQ and AAA domain-containing protein 1-like n=1 Tax=Leptidea sinapis TaxID=189913 RepID=UPI0021C4A5A8|nr:IQ and AAA domain-containing protein 1-like [Leptidea sinapis]